MDAAVAFGRVLRRLRNEVGLTQEKLGFEADLRRTYISILELGQQQPTLTTILKLSKPLKQSARDIVGQVEVEMRQVVRRPSKKSR